MSGRIVLTDEINYQIDTLGSASEGYSTIKNGVESSLNTVYDSMGKDLRGNYVKIIKNVNEIYKKLYEDCKSTQVMLTKCRDSYTNMDQELRNEVNNGTIDGNPSSWGLPGGESDSNQRVAQEYEYKDEKYMVLDNYDKCVQKQKLPGNCTSTAWCAGLTIINGEQYDATSWPYWGESGARWVGYDRITSNDVFGVAYDELMSGKPTVFYATNGNNISGKHAVTIIGLANDAKDRSALTADDFLVMDPGTGTIKKLSEVGYKTYSGATIYTYK